MGAGAITLCAAFAQWSAEPDLSFLPMLILGTLVSSRKVRLPGLTGTISGGFAFVLFVAAVSDWQSTVAMAALAALTQSLWAAKRRPAWYQVAFNVANIVVCAGLAHRASAAMVPEHAIGRLAIAGLLLFLVNTFSVSTVLCLVESRPLRSAWDQCRFWAAPYYLGGGVVSGALAGTAAGTTTQLPTLLCLACTMTLMSAYYRTLLAFLTKHTA